jgi:serine/threonine-protein kinase
VFVDWKRQPPTWKVFGDVFRQLLSALDAAHEKGIVHRDIKPDNAMAKRAAGYEWFVKVLDFGLAKSFEHGRAPEAEPIAAAKSVRQWPSRAAWRWRVRWRGWRWPAASCR